MISRKLSVIALVLSAGLLLTATAQASWDTIAPGVEYQSMTQSGPVQVRAARVDLCEAGVNVRATTEAENPGTTSSFGSSVDAEVAVNADFFDGSFNPIGFAMGDGDVWSPDPDTHGFVAAGDYQVMVSSPLDSPNTPKGWMSEAVGGNIMVLTDGTVTQDSGDFCTTRHPRTVAGLSADETQLILAVADGRSPNSIGMTCTELGQLMADLGAHNALNLDGGGSTTMWRSGVGVVNTPSDGTERTVANHLAVIADGSSPAMSCPQFDIPVDVGVVDGDVVNTDGGRDGVPDVFVGDEFQVEMVITNASAATIRDVWAQYSLDHPGVEAVDYTIYSDHPAHDQQSWEVNDANDAPENPDGAQLGDDGVLNLYAFSPGESKRILVEMEAVDPGFGTADDARLQGWMHSIEQIYGVQDQFGDGPDINRVGDLLESAGDVDVLTRDYWHFSGPEDNQYEGWRSCGGDTDGLSVDTDAGALVVGGDDRCVESPQWTSVAADDYDEVVVQTEAASPEEWIVQWEGSDTGQVEYSTGGEETTVFPVGDDQGWEGTVDRLQLEAPGADEVVIDAVFVQSSANETTSTPHLDYVDSGESGPVDENGDSDDEGDEGGDDAGVPADAADGGASDEEPEVGTGCACSAGPTGGFSVWLVVVLALVGWRYFSMGRARDESGGCSGEFV